MKRVMKKAGLCVAALWIQMAVVAEAVEYVYPVDVGVIDVTQPPWNFDNTGVEDVTAKFQQLVDATIPRKTWLIANGYWPYIIYFPNGTYRLSDSVVGAVLDFGSALGGTVIQGQSRDGVVFKLDDNAAGFGDAEQPKYVLDYFAGNATNNAFVNQLENVTLDVGSGNDGAVGLRFHANNTGAVRDVRIISTDPEGAGFAGLEAVKNTNGPWLIRGLEVEGFDYGINLGGGDNGRHMVSIQDLHLKGQNKAGIQLRNLIVTVVNGRSENTVPALVDLTETGMVNFLNMEIETPNGETTTAAAITSGSPVFLRDVLVNGYDSVVRKGEQVLLEQIPSSMEWHSHARNYLWEETPDQSLNLPVEQAPELEWPESSDWAIVESMSTPDLTTAAIRAAMASGKSAIVFKPGAYRVTDTIRIPPHVRLVAGQFATIRPETGLKGDGRPLFELGPTAQQTVVVEKILGAFDPQANPNPLIRNGSHGTLVLRDIFWVSGPVYRSEPTRGKVFFENVHNLPGTQNNPLNIASYEIRGQDAWAYQWNPEMLFPHMKVDGGQLRIYGGKAGEMRGPIVDVRNHGSAEVFGLAMNVTHDHLDIAPAETVMLLSEDSNISANFIEMAQLSGGASGWGRHQFVAVETRDGETRQLLNSDPSVQHRTGFSVQYGAVVNLYTGYFEATGSNAAPVPQVQGVNVDATGYRYTFRGFAEDPDNAPAGSPKLHWRVIAGPGIASTDAHVGEQVSFDFDRPGRYVIEATATDGVLESSSEFLLQVMPKNYSARLGRLDVNRYTDNFPQNGETDFHHPALLQLGDDGANTHSHLKFEIKLSELLGSADRVGSAHLRLRIDNIDNLVSLSASYAAQPSLGIHRPVDFTLERTPLGTVSLAGREVGDWIEVDIQDAVRAALAADFDYLALWLEAPFTNDSVANQVRFSSTVAADESQRPQFVVDFSPASIAEGSTRLGGAALLHPVYGLLHDMAPWIYHASLGWLYADPELPQGETLLVYSPEFGWLYTNDSCYPWVYVYDQQDWIADHLAM